MFFLAPKRRALAAFSSWCDCSVQFYLWIEGCVCLHMCLSIYVCIVCACTHITEDSYSITLTSHTEDSHSKSQEHSSKYIISWEILLIAFECTHRLESAGRRVVVGLSSGTGLPGAKYLLHNLTAMRAWENGLIWWISEVSQHWNSVILSQDVNLIFLVREKGHGVWSSRPGWKF